MKPVLLVYATREGHTRRIAEHLASAFRARGFPVEVHDAAQDEPISLGDYSAAVLAASIHMGRHEREMVRFAKVHRDELMTMPSAFLSVSLTEAGAEERSSDEDSRQRARHEVELMLEQFFHDTGWHPKDVLAVGGALLYTHYGRLLRLVMKKIAHASGQPEDATRDYVFTDWEALDHVVDGIAQALGEPPYVTSGGEAAHP